MGSQQIRKIKIPRITDEGRIPRNSCLAQWRGRERENLCPHPKLSLGLVPYRPLF